MPGAKERDPSSEGWWQECKNPHQPRYPLPQAAFGGQERRGGQADMWTRRDRGCRWGGPRAPPGPQLPLTIPARPARQPRPSPLSGAPAALHGASWERGAQWGHGHLSPTHPPTDTHTRTLLTRRQAGSAPGRSRITRSQTFLMCSDHKQDRNQRVKRGEGRGAPGNSERDPTHAPTRAKVGESVARERAARHSAGPVADTLLAEFPH